MPTYAYRCSSCSFAEDRFERMTKAPAPCACPACKAPTFERQIGAGVIADARLRASNQYPYTSRRLPLNMKGCRHDGYGHPIIESQRHEREIMAGAGNGKKWNRE